MKYLVLTLGIIVSLNSWSQSPVAAIESPEHNILYRGYANKVIPAITNNDGRVISVSAANASVSKVPNEAAFIVKPGKGKTVKLSISLKDEQGKIEVIKTVEYRIANLPVPSIYWGGLKSGGIGNITAKNLSIDYPEGVPLKNEFRILAWEMSAPNKTLTGNGNSLAPAEEFLKTIESGTILVFMVKVQSSDGITRIMAAQWEVKSWKEEVETNPLGFDRD